MGQAALIGAGLGAAGSALTGRNPFQGALLGGASGGLMSGASSLLPSLGASVVPASTVGQAVAANSIGDMGLQQVGSTFYNPEYFVGLNQGFPVFTGGQGVFSNAMDMAGNMIPESLSKNMTPSNLIGVGNLLANIDQRAPMAPSPIGAIRQGQMPQQYTFNTGGLIRG